MKMTFGFGLLDMSDMTAKERKRKHNGAVTATRCVERLRAAAGWQQAGSGSSQAKPSQCRSHAAAHMIDCPPRDK